MQLNGAWGSWTAKVGQIRCFTSQLPTSGGGDRQSAIAGRRKWGKSIATPRSCPLRRAGASSRRWLTGESGANPLLHLAVAHFGARWQATGDGWLAKVGQIRCFTSQLPHFMARGQAVDEGRPVKAGKIQGYTRSDTRFERREQAVGNGRLKKAGKNRRYTSAVALLDCFTSQLPASGESANLLRYFL